MTSSTLTGDRRWAASGRRGGVTVIGKVVVPKPINLPSQRLENHGLDPNVEIVPKGTLGWGSKSPSTASNPWGSSPNTDGGGGSPSCLSGRPSLGGSGTRPSTSGSDRAHEPVNNAWGQNSRPSSASGLLTSNQTTLTSLRPRSAETRPGSSHLSRFAESVPEYSGAWSAAGTAEKLVVTSYKKDGFSLASGDFPTLGSEKDNSGKSMESKDHAPHDRPGSSSGGVAPAKESYATHIDGESSVNANMKGGTADSWKREDHAYGVDATRPSGEKWHADPQPYPNANIHPQHFEAWRGPPVNNPPPGAIWYRGPPGAPAFGNPVPPGGFPMEPFPYFHPQMPGVAPVAGPRGPHPMDGDMYRPHMPDACIRPGMPIRPGFYPGPMPYNSYYGPPMGYFNANERDVPFMGMAAGPPFHNRFSGQNGPDPGSSKASSGVYGCSTGKASVPEQEDPGHGNVTRGPYKVLLKQHSNLDGKDDPKWEDSAKNIVTFNEKDNQSTTLHDNEWGADHKDEGINPRPTVGEVASDQVADRRGGRSVHAKDISAKKSEHAASSAESQQPFVSPPKGSTLIQKIEGLNAKARDAQPDVSSVSSRDEHRNKIHVKGNYAANEAGNRSVYNERGQSSQISTPPSSGEVVSPGDKNLVSTNAGGIVISRRSHDMQDRADHRGRGKSNTQEGNGWEARPPLLESPNKVLSAQAGTSNVCVLGRYTTVEASEKFGPYPQMKDKREVRAHVFDPNDLQQRLKQRQKEEEERINRQKANALAKLEELNRRSQAVEGSSNKRGLVQNSEEEPQVLTESVTVTSKFEGYDRDFAAQIGESKTARDEKSAPSSSESSVKMVECATKQPVVNDISVPLQHDALRNALPKQKHAGFKQKQNMSLEKRAAEKLSSIGTPEALKRSEVVLVSSTIASPEVATNGSGSNFQPILPVNPNINVDSSMQQRRKNRGVKNKHKVEVVSSTSLPSSTPKDANLVKVSSKKDKPEAPEPEMPSSSLGLALASKDANYLSDHHSSFPSEESHVRVNKHSHRVQRNPQTNRAADKFLTADAVWAPVRPCTKVEIADESCNKTVLEAVTPVVKNDTVQDNNAKNKRAEIEIYVPKPAAKELAHPGNNQQPVVSSENRIEPNEAVASAGSCSVSTGSRKTTDSVVGSRNEERRQNKQGKAHGSWRQRGASESTSYQELQDGLSYPSSSDRNVQKPVEHRQPKKSELSLQIGQVKLTGLGNAADIWNIPGNSDFVVKDQGVTGRGKHQAFREHKSMGNSNDNDQKKVNAKSYAQPLDPQMSQTDSTASKENRATGERSTTHWQPKSSAFSASNQLDYGQSLNSESSTRNKKESTSHSGMPLQSQHKETGESMAQPRHDHISGKSHVEVGQEDTKNREKKLSSIKGRPQLPNQGPVEPASGDTHRSSSGFHKNGNHNSRFGRRHDSRGDWSSSRQDIRHNNQPASHERQRHDSQYEYQPVGSYNNTSKPSNVEGPSDSSHNTGARFRGQGHSRRGVGRFHGRQNESARVDAGYD